jgi:anthranilate phosphoribosyltransferase
LDELSVTGVNRVSHLRAGEVSSFDLDPKDLGLQRDTLAALVGGTPEENAAITRAVLDGSDRGPRRDVVLLNAAALLSAEDNDWQRGLVAARESIDSGAALATLQSWIARTNAF